jgi:hypothetical protein
MTDTQQANPLTTSYYVYIENYDNYPNGRLNRIQDHPAPAGLFAAHISERVMTGQEILDMPALGWRTEEGRKMMRRHGILAQEPKPAASKPAHYCSYRGCSSSAVSYASTGWACADHYDVMS